MFQNSTPTRYQFFKSQLCFCRSCCELPTKPSHGCSFKLKHCVFNNWYLSFFVVLIYCSSHLWCLRQELITNLSDNTFIHLFTGKKLTIYLIKELKSFLIFFEISKNKGTFYCLRTTNSFYSVYQEKLFHLSPIIICFCFKIKNKCLIQLFNRCFSLIHFFNRSKQSL